VELITSNIKLHVFYKIIKSDTEGRCKFESLVSGKDFVRCVKKLALREPADECMNLVNYLKEIGLMRGPDLTFPIVMGGRAKLLKHLVRKEANALFSLFKEKLKRYWIIFRTIALLGELDFALQNILIKNDIRPQKTNLGEIFLSILEIVPKYTWIVNYDETTRNYLIRTGLPEKTVHVNNFPKELNRNSDIVKNLANSIFNATKSNSEGLEILTDRDEQFNHMFYQFATSVQHEIVAMFMKNKEILWDAEIIYKPK